MKTVFQPLFPDISKARTIISYSKLNSIEIEWVMRKHEIRNVLASFLRQRENAYKEYNSLTIERAHAISNLKIELKNITVLYGDKYIISLLRFLDKCSDFMPSNEKLYSTWQTRFNKITDYCNRFLINSHK